MSTINITVIGLNTATDLEIKTKALQTLATLDIQTLQRLEKLASNQNAVKKFNGSWLFVKNYIGIK